MSRKIADTVKIGIVQNDVSHLRTEMIEVQRKLDVIVDPKTGLCIQIAENRIRNEGLQRAFNQYAGITIGIVGGIFTKILGMW